MIKRHKISGCRPAGRLALGAGVAAVALAAGSQMASAQETLNVYNWSDYIAEDTIANFEEQTGIRVNYDVYDSNAVVEAKLLAGNSGYDLVVPTAVPYLARQIEAGIYMPLDRSKIPNWDKQDPDLLQPIGERADPNNEHAAIYMWGTNGFGYNVKAVEERIGDAPVDSYAMLFEPEIVEQLADCGVAFLDEASEVFPVLLHYLGYEPYDEDPDALAAAEERMMELRPHIRYFHSSQYINDLANGEICLAYGWSGDAVDGALFALLVPGLIRAQDERGQAVDFRSLERRNIGRTHFRVEATTITISRSALSRMNSRCRIRLLLATGNWTMATWRVNWASSRTVR